MARDHGLEALIDDDLGSVSRVTSKGMFGGWAWLVRNHLLCGARHDGLLVRLGKGNDGWALQIDGISPMYSGSRPMHGWVRADASAYDDEQIRSRLLSAALQFVGTLPPR